MAGQDTIVLFASFPANEKYFSLTTNQSTVLSVMAYQPNEQDNCNITLSLCEKEKSCRLSKSYYVCVCPIAAWSVQSSYVYISNSTRHQDYTECIDHTVRVKYGFIRWSGPADTRSNQCLVSHCFLQEHARLTAPSCFWLFIFKLLITASNTCRFEFKYKSTI